jgi:hypothetical protein
MSRTLQTSTVFFSRVSCLFECNANDTYVLRVIHVSGYEENCAKCLKRSFYSKKRDPPPAGVDELIRNFRARTQNVRQKNAETQVFLALFWLFKFGCKDVRWKHVREEFARISFGINNTRWTDPVKQRSRVSGSAGTWIPPVGSFVSPKAFVWRPFQVMPPPIVFQVPAWRQAQRSPCLCLPYQYFFPLFCRNTTRKTSIFF